ncbi:type II secretion system protein J [Deinococcus lacus]|uniref:Type II secretion system protein J n=1 Tax=Deinococcus lacus TaxID=392561 RepID=A0ABW1YFA4_9DEIO
MRNTGGFTIVEVLVAVAIFAIIVAILTSSLVGILGVNRQSQQGLAITSDVQRVAEAIKAAWTPEPVPKRLAISDRNAQLAASNSKALYRYSLSCVPDLALPAGAIVVITSLDKRGNAVAGTGTAAPALTKTCAALPTAAQVTAAAATAPAMKRVVVTGRTGNKMSTITLDLVRP